MRPCAWTLSPYLSDATLVVIDEADVLAFSDTGSDDKEDVGFEFSFMSAVHGTVEDTLSWTSDLFARGHRGVHPCLDAVMLLRDRGVA